MEDRLKKFVTLVDAGSFTAAAEKLHTSQPALSNAMQKLERELKAPLLERGSHSLTQAGEIAYAHGKLLQTQARNLSTQLSDLEAQKLSLRIGMIDSLADIAFGVGDEFQHTAAYADVALTVEDSTRLINALDQGALDIVFVAQQDEYPLGLQVYKQLGNEPMVLVTTPDQANEITSDLKTGVIHRFLAYNTSTTETIIRRATLRQGIAADTAFSANAQILFQLVLAGKGSAVLPYFLVKDAIKARALSVIELGGQSAINRPIVALTRKQAIVPKLLDAMAGRTQTALHELSVAAYADVLASTDW